jgi:hypothetical protein
LPDLDLHGARPGGNPRGAGGNADFPSGGSFVGKLLVYDLA